MSPFRERLLVSQRGSDTGGFILYAAIPEILILRMKHLAIIAIADSSPTLILYSSIPVSY
jgi:hypothetical protein